MSLLPALLLSTGLAVLALWRRALTPDGTALAWALCIVITAVGGRTAIAVLAVTLLVTAAADRFAGGRTDPTGVRRKSGSRDAARIACNVGVASGAVLGFALTGSAAFLAGFGGAMAESLADSLASKLGPLSRRQPRDIWSRAPVTAGLSGGVSLPGTIAELLGAAIIAAVCALGYHRPQLFPVVFAAGFLGAVFDSILGSRAQVKYRCCVCGTITERETHCAAPTFRISGAAWVSNDTVNLLSNLFSALLAFGIASI